jgi:hypothetical protein
MASYPETLLRNSPPENDPDYGGQPANRWGKQAFSWVNSVLQFFEETYLKVTYRPHGSIFVTVQQAVAAGDVVCIFPDEPITNARYYAKRYATGSTNVQILGIALTPASADGVTQVITYGIVPASASGLIGISENSFDVGLNATTGRMREAETGDVILGRCDGQGNVLVSCFFEAVP